MKFFNAFTLATEKNYTTTPSIASLYVRKYLPHFQLQKSLTKRFSVFYDYFFLVLLKKFFQGIVDITRTENSISAPAVQVSNIFQGEGIFHFNHYYPYSFSYLLPYLVIGSFFITSYLQYYIYLPMTTLIPSIPSVFNIFEKYLVFSLDFCHFQKFSQPHTYIHVCWCLLLLECCFSTEI